MLRLSRRLATSSNAGGGVCFVFKQGFDPLAK
jgi:hypothetical protein